MTALLPLAFSAPASAAGDFPFCLDGRRAVPGEPCWANYGRAAVPHPGEVGRARAAQSGLSAADKQAMEPRFNGRPDPFECIMGYLAKWAKEDKARDDALAAKPAAPAAEPPPPPGFTVIPNTAAPAAQSENPFAQWAKPPAALPPLPAGASFALPPPPPGSTVIPNTAAAAPAFPADLIPVTPAPAFDPSKPHQVIIPLKRDRNGSLSVQVDFPAPWEYRLGEGRRDVAAWQGPVGDRLGEARREASWQGP